MTSSFIESGNNMFNKIPGENGALQYESTSNIGLDLFFHLVRGYPVKEDLEHCLTSNNPNELADLFVLAFQTRNCRGGKGERDLFVEMIVLLFQHYPQTIIDLMHLIPHYGYYKDYVHILDTINKNVTDEYKPLENKIIDIIISQIHADDNELEKCQLENRIPVLSLVSKYAPRPNKLYRKIAIKIYRKMYPNDKKAEEKYRKQLTKLNKALSTTEIKMCAKNYSSIDYSKVPSKCLFKWRKAFLNELCKEPCPEELEKTGNRYPTDTDRVSSRNNLIDNVKNKTIHGKQLMPHEIIEKMFDNVSVAKTEEDLLTVQWEKIREDVLKNMNNDKKGINLSNIVPLIDVSGSMNGEPMLVAIGLGLLVSEINNPAFRDTFITFSGNPTWVSLKGLTLLEKIRKTKASEWGGSTDFIKAIHKILDIVVSNKLSESEIPDLLVLSDMQFNQATGKSDKFETSYELIQQLFIDAGMSICDKPYRTPRIIFWNLRSSPGHGVPVQAITKNVQLLSGFSPSMLSLLLKGEDLSPLSTYRLVVEDEMYDRVRIILHESQEKQLIHYKTI
jgi:hypothetical protein